MKAGIVKSIEGGRAYVKDANGTTKLLSVGDVVNVNDKISTSSGTILTVQDSKGILLSLPESSSTTLTSCDFTDFPFIDVLYTEQPKKPIVADDSETKKAVAKVTALEGKAFAEDENGQRRELHVGDLLYLNEKVLVAHDGKATIEDFDKVPVQLE